MSRVWVSLVRFGEAPQGKLGDGVCDTDNNQELHSLVHYGGLLCQKVGYGVTLSHTPGAQSGIDRG